MLNLKYALICFQNEREQTNNTNNNNSSLLYVSFSGLCFVNWSHCLWVLASHWKSESDEKERLLCESKKTIFLIFVRQKTDKK